MKTSKPKRIFISRKLKPDSLFHNLSQAGHQVVAESLVDIHPIDFKVTDTYEAVFFYSQIAISLFFNKYPYDHRVSYGVMGTGSQQVFEEITGQTPEIIGQGKNLELAADINTLWNDKTVLFPQAKNSLRSLETLLTELTINNVVIYTNQPKDKINLPSCDIYLFTSPLNAKTFYQNNSTEDAIVYAIGAATAHQIRQETGQVVPYCSEPSINHLYQLTLTKL